MYISSRKTKIVATIGPGSESPENFATLLRAGVNVARTNMSHDDHAAHTKRIKTIRSVSKKENIPVAILQDLSGPKIRIGDFKDGVVELTPGQQLILSGKKCEGTPEKVFFNYPHIKKDIKPGQILMLDDGKKKLQVDKVIGSDVYTTVLVGGKTKSRRGVNIPGAYLSISALTDKDKQDLKLGVELGVDFMALSFVRTASDIEELRAQIAKNGGTQMIVAKIETEEAVENIDEIIAVTDAVMVARGDLAIEIGPARVPSIQKMIIKKCNSLGKPVIVATQMLESMIAAPVPTRAEVSDVANAVFDGADAVMLSEESALGAFAFEAVMTLHNVAVQIEGEIGTHRRLKVRTNDIVDSVCSSVVHDAEDIGAKAIVALTRRGGTARMLARYRPQQPIIVLTLSEETARKMLLVYGCTSLVIKPFKRFSQYVENVGKTLVQKELLKPGDRFITALGLPFESHTTTNTMLIQEA
jgi:pyruvate kinase